MWKHYGCFQAQGPRTEQSVRWGQDQPLTATDARKLLQTLEAKLTPTELAERRVAFRKARKFIADAETAGGVIIDGRPISKTWSDPGRLRSIRVDIEIWAGAAFVPDKE